MTMQLIMARARMNHRAVGGDPYWTSVASLLHFDGANGGTTFPDASGRVWTSSGSGIVTSTDAAMFGGASGKFSGGYLTSSYWSSSNADDWWRSDFTVEAFVNITALTGWSDTGDNNSTFMGHSTPATGTADWTFGPRSDGNVRFQYWNGAIVRATGASTLPLNTWTHIAAVLHAGYITVYINGVGGPPVALSGTPAFTSGVPLSIGKYRNSAIAGYVDDLRITRGVARYTSNFTPPAAPFANHA